MKHNKITHEKVAPEGNFSIDLTDKIFHIGHTNVDYSVSTNGKASSVSYSIFSRDGFWDPDFIDEKLLVEFHTLTNGLRQSLMEWGRILKDLEVSPITIFRENLHSISNL